MPSKPVSDSPDGATGTKRWLIGRDPQCDLVVEAQGVSSRHCTLTRTGDGYFLEDNGSTNGTYVNGKRISARTPVTPKDEITLGATASMPWPKQPSPAL